MNATETFGRAVLAILIRSSMPAADRLATILREAVRLRLVKDCPEEPDADDCCHGYRDPGDCPKCGARR